MKKLMILAMMALGVSSAFAGASDALKSIMKAKTYAEAAQLLQSNFEQLQGSEEKAKAYDLLCQLARKDFDKQSSVETLNAQYAQLKQEKSIQPFDTLAMYTSLDQAFAAAAKCNEYDQQPNAKGKVKPKFQDANAQALWSIRPQLINGGIYYQNKQDNDNAYKFLANYVDTYDWPLFAKQDKSNDANLTNIAYFATVYAYQHKDWKKAEKYVEIALKDADRAKDAENLQLAIYQAQLQTKEDTTAYISKLKAILDKNPDNQTVFGTLYSMYLSENMTPEADKLVADALQRNPDNTMALKAKGQGLLLANKYDEALEVFDKILAKTPNDALINYFAGVALCQKAQEATDRVGKSGRIAPAAQQQINKVWSQAAEKLEAAKAADPTQQQTHWAAQLYRIYYLLYGENDSRTQTAKSDAGM